MDKQITLPDVLMLLGQKEVELAITRNELAKLQAKLAEKSNDREAEG